jgi:CheY-like chemotaxis protein
VANLLSYWRVYAQSLMFKPILLVEDSTYDRDLALFALKRSNLANETVVVRDGEEALDYLFREGQYSHRPTGNPALVILDLQLPKISGLEVLQAVRERPELAHVPIVMLTGSKEERALLHSYEFGANAFVVKPVEFRDLVEAIGNIGAFWLLRNKPPPGSINYASPDADN